MRPMNSNRGGGGQFDDMSRNTLGTENSERDAIGLVAKKPSKAQELMQQIMPTFIVNQEQFTDAATANEQDFGESDGGHRSRGRKKNIQWESEKNDDGSPFKLTKLNTNVYQIDGKGEEQSNRGGGRSTRSHGSKGSRKRANRGDDSD